MPESAAAKQPDRPHQRARIRREWTLAALLPYLYLLRVPLLCWLVIVGGTWYGSQPTTYGGSILGGLFHLEGNGAIWVILAALMTSYTLFLTALLVIDYGHLRFGLSYSPATHRPARTMRRLVVGLCALLPAIGIVSAIQTAGSTRWKVVLFGLVVFGLMIAIDAAAWRYGGGSGTRLLAWFFRATPHGYLGTEQRMLPGHGLAAVWASTFLAVYVVVGLVRGLRLNLGTPWPRYDWINPPPLAFLLLLIAVVCWGLGACAFLLDRWRVPLILPLVVLVAISNRLPHTGHVFEVTPFKHDRLEPAAVLRAGRAPVAPPVIVCASGGGVHAAAWTVTVVGELEKRFPHEFARSVRLISGASGGSVGAIHLAAAYENASLPPSVIPAVFYRAAASSLAPVAWGFAFPDLLRMFALAPSGWPVDRGWAAERAWDPGRRLPRALNEWRADVAGGTRPALLLSATIVETGRQVVFANFDFNKGRSVSLLGTVPPETFHDLYDRHYDVPVTTAARLSATFPFVFPVARVSDRGVPAEPFHFVDGGYYDNYGVTAAVSFLDQALAPRANRPTRVLIVEIRASDPEAGAGESARRRGAGHQATAPLSALLRVRDVAQRARNGNELALLEKALALHKIELVHTVFKFPDSDPPLSWHLTPSQRDAVPEGWNRAFAPGSPMHSEVEKVARFLRSAGPVWQP